MSGESEGYKKQAAEAAVELVRSGMVVGLGHGSTARFAIRRLSERLAAGELEEVRGVACSRFVEEEARLLGIPLTTLEEDPRIDITIDGADEIGPHLNLIKGGGGALLREKIVAQASRREVIVADESKLVQALGTGWAVPVEVVPFGWYPELEFLTELGAEVTVRKRDDKPFLTDHGNMILDADFGVIADPIRLAVMLNTRAGIVEHGLFLGLATDAIVAGAEGIRHMVAARE